MEQRTGCVDARSPQHQSDFNSCTGSGPNVHSGSLGKGTRKSIVIVETEMGKSTDILEKILIGEGKHMRNDKE